MTVPFLDIKKQYAPLLDEIEGELRKLFESCSFVGGQYVETFEREMQDYLGVRHAIGCGNGTEALVLALRACGVKPGDEVITTAFSFFATAEAISAIGAIPVFVDIQAWDYTIDPKKIESAITKKTKAILPVQIFGACCDMDEIVRIAREHGLKVIEDDAQAIGSTYKGRKAGTLADIGCFSFYPTKNLGGCGDGGMCTTDDDDLAAILLALREHGAGRYGAHAAELLGERVRVDECSEKATDLYDPYKYQNFLIGYNSRLDAIQAKVLSIKLRKLDEYNARRTAIAERYIEGLDKKALYVPGYPEYTKPCWHQFAIICDFKQELCAYLAEHGIGSGTFYPVPLHKQKAFNEGNSKNCNAGIPIAEAVSGATVCLPIFPEMTDEQVEYVIETVNVFFKGRQR